MKFIDKFLLFFLMSIFFNAKAEQKTIELNNDLNAFNDKFDKESIKYQNELPKFNENIKNYSNNDLIILEKLLKEENYIDFYKKIVSIPIKKETFLNFLLSHKFNGHVPIYWFLADFYAKEGNIAETHKWYYIALIMTQQDSYLCRDTTTRGTPRYLMKFYTEALELTRKTPNHIDKSMREVVFFLDNLKTRSNPNWVCHYGQFKKEFEKDPLIDKDLWNETRQKILKRFTDKLNFK